MSSRNRRDRMLMPKEMSNPESAQPPIENREPEPVPELPATELRRPRVRLADIKPVGQCRILEWTEGALAALEAGTPAAARTLAAPDGCACRDCWLKGRNAVVAAMESAAA